MNSLFLALVLMPMSLSALGQASSPYQDPNLPPEQRAADLVGRMSLEEKVLQMQNSAPAIPRLGVPEPGPNLGKWLKR